MARWNACFHRHAGVRGCCHSRPMVTDTYCLVVASQVVLSVTILESVVADRYLWRIPLTSDAGLVSS
eukprot:42793-Eustigmatos_ZCMA.PRE.1